MIVIPRKGSVVNARESKIGPSASQTEAGLCQTSTCSLHVRVTMVTASDVYAMRMTVSTDHNVGRISHTCLADTLNMLTQHRARHDIHLRY